MDISPEVVSGAVASVGKRGRRSGRDDRKAERLPGEARRIAYLYIAPAFILYAAFNLWPLVQGANISLFHWDGITEAPGRGCPTTRTSSPTR
jgi:raffinose/stachyose/melibiose transport system permease protein